MTYSCTSYHPALIIYKTKEYLKNLFEMTHFKDIIERNKLKKSSSLDELCSLISFSDKGMDMFYIQIAANISEKSTRERETRSFLFLNDQVRKIIVTGQNIKDFLFAVKHGCKLCTRHYIPRNDVKTKKMALQTGRPICRHGWRRRAKREYSVCL